MVVARIIITDRANVVLKQMGFFYTTTTVTATQTTATSIMTIRESSIDSFL